MAVSKVTVHFPCSVERIWQVVTDLSHTAWRSDLKRVEILDETHFVEHTNRLCHALHRYGLRAAQALGLHHGERQHVRFLGGDLRGVRRRHTAPMH